MIYLLLNIIFASSFLLFIKWAQIRQTEDVITIGTLNYIIAALLIAPLFSFSPPETWTPPAIWTGATLGLAYFIAYFFAIYAIRWIGVASSAVVSVLSILVPIGFGIYVWGEDPSAWQVGGIFLALGALMLIVGPSSRTALVAESSAGSSSTTSPTPVRRSWFAPYMLVLFFLLCGLNRLAQEAFRHWCTKAEIMTFNFSAFSLAAVPSTALLLVRRKRIQRTELAFAFGMGLSNFLQIQFILESLQRFPGFIVFPVVSAGGIILTTLVATMTLGERLTARKCTGIATAAVALVLLQGLGPS